MTVRKELRAKTDPNTWENSACMFASSAFLSCQPYLTQKEQPAHRLVSLILGWTSLYQSLVINQEKASQRLPKAILN